MVKRIIKKIRYELKFSNINYYTRASEKVLKSLYKRKLRKRLDALPPIVLNPANARLTLATLANKKNFYESVAALYSFSFWKRDINIHYHEDGTLDDSDILFLRTKFPGIQIFLRNTSDKKVVEDLSSKDLDNCISLRKCFFLSIKLFDQILEKKTPYLLHIDSDALFFKKPEQIIGIVDSGELNGCYNADVREAYTFDTETMTTYTGRPMLESFNSGLLLHNFDKSIFKFIEQVMEGRADASGSWHLEQTLLAMYASYQGSFLKLPKTYDVGRVGRKNDMPLVSEHYVHNTGYELHKDFINKISPQFFN